MSSRFKNGRSRRQGWLKPATRRAKRAKKGSAAHRLKISKGLKRYHAGKGKNTGKTAAQRRNYRRKYLKTYD